MPRIARIIAVDYPHHITQRGNRKQTTFLKDQDYLNYLKIANKYFLKYQASVLAYCIMPNHVHFVAIPKKETSFARIFSTSHMLYAQYFNEANKTTGHLWQGRFYSCVLDETHLYASIKYAENNPVRAKLVKSPAEWKWSSTREHLGKEASTLSLANIKEFINVNDWMAYLKEGTDDKIEESIRKNTLLGRPAGSKLFIEKLENSIGKKLHASRVGRPKK
jgi:putative transposase